MTDLDARVGVVAPRIPTFSFAEAESYVVGDLYRGGVAVDMLWFHPTSEYPEIFKNLGGIVVESVNEGNFKGWDSAKIKTAGAIAGWDRVVTNAIHHATELKLPVFTKVPFEEVGYYDFVLNQVISFSNAFEGQHPRWIDGAEYVVIERGSRGAQTIQERLQER